MEACVIKSFIHWTVGFHDAQAVLGGPLPTGRRLPICRVPVHTEKEW